MDRFDTLLAPVIVAFLAGMVAGSWGERWLLWRCLSDARWVYRRMVFLGDTDRVAVADAPKFAALALALQVRHPLLMVMWLIREQRRLIALLCLAIIASAGLAIYLK